MNQLKLFIKISIIKLKWIKQNLTIEINLKE